MLWLVFVIVLPYIGVFVFLVSYHDGMAERNVKQLQAKIDEYVKSVAGDGGAAGGSRPPLIGGRD